MCLARLPRGRGVEEGQKTRPAELLCTAAGRRGRYGVAQKDVLLEQQSPLTTQRNVVTISPITLTN